MALVVLVISTMGSFSVEGMAAALLSGGRKRLMFLNPIGQDDPIGC